MTFSLSTLVSRLFGPRRLSPAAHRAAVIDVLNDITAVAFPDHGWAAYPRARGSEHVYFALVSRAEAARPRIPFVLLSETPQTAVEPVFRAFLEAGVPEMFRNPYAPKTEMRIGTHSVSHRGNFRLRIDNADLDFLQAHKDAIRQAAGRAGIRYRLHGAPGAPCNAL